MKQTIKLLGIGYIVASSAVVTFVLLHAAIRGATGKSLSPRAEAVCRAILARPPADGNPRSGTAAASGVAPSAAALPPQSGEDFRLEMMRSAGELRLWQGRLEILSEDARRALEQMESRNQAAEEHRRSWERMRGALAALLDRLLAGRPGWQPISPERLEAMLLEAAAGGGESPAGGEMGLAALLEALREEREKETERFALLRALPADAVAGILAARPAPGAAAGLTDEQAVRFLVSIEETRAARIFKLLQEENPARASSLMALLIGRRGEAGGFPGREGGG